MSTTQIVLSVLSIIAVLLLIFVAKGVLAYLKTKEKSITDGIRNEKIENIVQYVQSFIQLAVQVIYKTYELQGKEVPTALAERSEFIQKIVDRVNKTLSSGISEYLVKHTIEDWDKWLDTQVAFMVARFEENLELANQQKQQQKFLYSNQ